MKTTIFTVLIIASLSAPLAPQVLLNTEDNEEEVIVVFDRTMSFEDLVDIRLDLKKKGVDLTYNNLTFDGLKRLKGISFMVDFNDGFSGGAGKSKLRGKSFGFFRDYKSKIPFGVGNITMIKKGKESTDPVKSSKNIYWIIGISLGFGLLLASAVPLRVALSDWLSDDKEIRLVAGIVARCLILFLAFYLIKKFRFVAFLGKDSQFKSKDLLSIVVPLVFISMGLFGGWGVYKTASVNLLSLFLISNLLVALVEEFVFRGLVLPLILKVRSKKRRLLLMSVFLTALIFGVLHYLNLFREPNNFSGITSQVIFALCIGIYLGGLMLRTRNILFPIVIHFLINISFGKEILKPEINEVVTQVVERDTNWGSMLLTFGLFGLIALGGVYMVRLVDKADVLKLLNKENDLL